MNPKCQKCIRIAIVLLFIFVTGQIILAVMKATYTKNVVAAEVMQEVLLLTLENLEIERIEEAFEMTALVVAMLTTAGIVCALASLLSARCCNRPCNGFWTKWYVAWSVLVFLTVSLVFLIIGSALAVIKDQFDSEAINK